MLLNWTEGWWDFTGAPSDNRSVALQPRMARGLASADPSPTACSPQTWLLPEASGGEECAAGGSVKGGDIRLVQGWAPWEQQSLLSEGGVGEQAPLQGTGQARRGPAGTRVGLAGRWACGQGWPGAPELTEVREAQRSRGRGSLGRGRGWGLGVWPLSGGLAAPSTPAEPACGNLCRLWRRSRDPRPLGSRPGKNRPCWPLSPSQPELPGVCESSAQTDLRSGPPSPSLPPRISGSLPCCEPCGRGLPDPRKARAGSEASPRLETPDQERTLSRWRTTARPALAGGGVPSAELPASSPSLCVCAGITAGRGAEGGGLPPRSPSLRQQLWIQTEVV